MGLDNYTTSIPICKLIAVQSYISTFCCKLLIFMNLIELQYKIKTFVHIVLTIAFDYEGEKKEKNNAHQQTPNDYCRGFI
jgi:hypothetical protein